MHDSIYTLSLSLRTLDGIFHILILIILICFNGSSPANFATEKTGNWTIHPESEIFFTETVARDTMMVTISNVTVLQRPFVTTKSDGVMSTDFVEFEDDRIVYSISACQKHYIVVTRYPVFALHTSMTFTRVREDVTLAEDQCWFPRPSTPFAMTSVTVHLFIWKQYFKE